MYICVCMYALYELDFHLGTVCVALYIEHTEWYFVSNNDVMHFLFCLVFSWYHVPTHTCLTCAHITKCAIGEQTTQA